MDQGSSSPSLCHVGFVSRVGQNGVASVSFVFSVYFPFLFIFPLGRHQGVVFVGGNFRKGVRVQIVGDGLGVGFRRVVGGGFPVVEMKRGRGWGGWGGWAKKLASLISGKTGRCRRGEVPKCGG